MKISIKPLFVIVAVFQSISIQAQGTDKPSPIDTITSNSKIESGLTPSSDDGKTLFSTKIDFSRLQYTNELSVFDVLQGKISGLDIISASGNPGRNAQATLRGQGSPLIVINGIPQKNHDDLFNSFNFNGEDIRSMIPVSVADIQSVELLKDGSAAALYGADGANGVILIETKKGGMQKMGVTYQFNQSIIKEPSFMPMLSGRDYARYQIEAYYNSRFLGIWPKEIEFDPTDPDYYNYSANTNWLKAVTQKGFASNHHLNIFGGNEKNRYYGSINYLDQTGTIINTGYNRLLSRLNFEHYLTKKLTLALNLNYTNSKNNGNVIPEEIPEGGGRNLVEMAFVKAPNMSIWEYDAEGNRTGDYFVPENNYQGTGRDYYNPVAVSELGNSTSTFNELTTTAYLQYDFKPWLNFRESFSYNRFSAVSKAFLPHSAFIDYDHQPDINSKSDLGFEEFRNELQASIKIPFKDDMKNVLKGTFTWINQNKKYEEYRSESYNWEVRMNILEENRNAAVSSIHYKLLDRYILNVNSRFESLSKDYQDNNIWDKHYSISTGWRFSGESFFKKIKFLDDGIIHVGWGSSSYQFVDAYILDYSVSGYSTSPLHFEDYFGAFNNDNYFNNNIECFDLGIDLSLFDNRVHFTGDFYNRRNYYEDHAFFAESKFEELHKGWEFMVDNHLIRTENLDWTVRFNIAQNKKVFLDLPGYFSWSQPLTVGEEYASHVYVNEAPGAIYGLLYEGVYVTDEDAVALDREGNRLVDGSGTPIKLSYNGYYTFVGGDAKYKDMNYDGRIDENDVVYLGNSYPKVTGGFGSTIRFKTLTLTCDFHYRSGYKTINQIAMDSEGLYYRNNQSEKLYPRWRRPGDEGPNIMPRAYVNHPANNLASDRYVEDGGYIRMNYISLGYQVTPAVCQKLKIKGLSVSLSGQRLLTQSNYSGLDPEIEMLDNNFPWFSKDKIRVVPPKIFTMSIRITV
jgi:TonB-linked SusC/RagA family outer membrane protein